MIFGFGKKQVAEIDDDEEVELVMFQGALNGKDANLAANARLAGAGLVPAKELVTDGLLRRAEAIRLEPKGESTAVSFIIDGLRYPGGRLPKAQANAITQVLKLLSGLDVAQRRKSQSGGLKAEFDAKAYELRIDSRPIQGGAERLMIRSTNLSQNLDTPDELGFPDEMKKLAREATGKRQGLVVVCGPSGSGVTTTLFAVLRGIDTFVYHVFAVGKLGGRSLRHIGKFDLVEGESFEQTLDRCVRLEADIVYLDPLSSAEAAKAVFKRQEHASFVVEVPAIDAATCVSQLVKWVGDANAVAGGLNAVISQKLIRKLCTECREAYRPNPKLLEKVGLPKDTKVLYRKPKDEEKVDECRNCNDVGYIGRAAMFEVIELTDEMQKLVATNPAPAAIKAQARKEKMVSFARDGVRLVGNGTTSLEELQRAFKPG